MPSATTGSDATKLGSLTIAGSGIASVAHITLETISYMKDAHRVFYLVSDPVTESFIQDKNSNTFDLSVFYDKSKARYRTYVEIAEVMLKEVRAGHNVLGIFYGHPGIFVLPSHRALTLARQEGYKAQMLPGISAMDYMLAELEVEPAQYGCMSSDATELLAHNRPLNPSVHNIIWQIGMVGVSTNEYEKSNLQMLVDRLEQDFGPDHKLVHYAGAITPQSSSAMVVFTVNDLRNVHVAKQISGRSTLYIPPRDIPPIHAPTAAALQLPAEPMGILGAPAQWVEPRFVAPAEYGPFESLVVSQLDQHVIPEGHKSLHASPAMREFMIRLALEPTLREEYKNDPSSVAETVSGITDRERFALRFGSDGPVRAIMLRASIEEPTEEELDEAHWNVGAGNDGSSHGTGGDGPSGVAV